MATLEPPFSKADPTTDIGTIWKEAIDRYEEITMVKIQSLARAKDVDEILNDVREKETKFKSYRHDDSKLDKFRTLVSKSLSPIEKVGDVIASAASTVRRKPVLARWLAITHINIAIGLPSQHYHLHGGSLSYERKIFVYLCIPGLNEPQTANAVSADYDKIVGFFEDLDLYLNRLKILENWISPVPELGVALAQVLSSVLVLCGICEKYVKMKRLGKSAFFSMPILKILHFWNSL